jgi:CTD small phosphatase-like protein 2
MSRGIILERLGVMVILLESMGQSEDFEEVLQNVKNLLLYIHNNQIQMLESLSEKLQAGEKGKQIDARLAKLQASKPAKKAKMDRFSLIKKNNNIIFSILTLMYRCNV